MSARNNNVPRIIVPTKRIELLLPTKVGVLPLHYMSIASSFYRVMLWTHLLPFVSKLICTGFYAELSATKLKGLYQPMHRNQELPYFQRRAVNSLCVNTLLATP